jgi:hypothetical protein
MTSCHYSIEHRTPFGSLSRTTALPASGATAISARVVLDLPEGPGSLRIAIEDLSATRSGSLEAPGRIPAPVGRVAPGSFTPRLSQIRT